MARLASSPSGPAQQTFANLRPHRPMRPTLDAQSQTAANQNKDLREAECGESGRKREAGGTQEGRNVGAFASRDKPLNVLPNTTGFDAGDRWDANSPPLSSPQQQHDGNAAQAESNVNFNLLQRLNKGMPPIQSQPHLAGKLKTAGRGDFGCDGHGGARTGPIA